jgi:hypothetical protein
MTLRDLQSLHVQLTAKLIEFTYAQGYQLSWGEAFRTHEQALWDAEEHIGILGSLHCERLAVDLLLFKDGQYLTDPKDYRFMGEYWKSLDPQCRWGGDFASVDADHFSVTWNNTA